MGKDDTRSLVFIHAAGICMLIAIPEAFTNIVHNVFEDSVLLNIFVLFVAFSVLVYKGKEFVHNFVEFCTEYPNHTLLNKIELGICSVTLLMVVSAAIPSALAATATYALVLSVISLLLLNQGMKEYLENHPDE